MAEVNKCDVDMKVLTSNKAYGLDSKSGDYYLLGNTKITARRLTLEFSRTSIVRITLMKYDNSTITIGYVNPTEKPRIVDFIFGALDQLDDIQVYTHKTSAQWNGLRIKTLSGRIMEAHVDDTQKGNPHRIPKGSGYFVGIFGDAEIEVVSLGMALRRDELTGLEKERLDKQLQPEMERIEHERERKEHYEREYGVITR